MYKKLLTLTFLLGMSFCIAGEEDTLNAPQFFSHLRPLETISIPAGYALCAVTACYTYGPEACTHAIITHVAPCSFLAHLCFSKDKRKALSPLLHFCTLSMCTRFESCIPPFPNNATASLAIGAAFFLLDRVSNTRTHPQQPYSKAKNTVTNLAMYAIAGFSLTSLLAPAPPALRAVRLFGAASWMIGEVMNGLESAGLIQDFSLRHRTSRDCFFGQHSLTYLATAIGAPRVCSRLLESTVSSVLSILFLEGLEVPIARYIFPALGTD